MKTIPTEVILSLDGSEGFIIRTLKEYITMDPIQFGCAKYADMEGKKYEIDYKDKVNENETLESIEFWYYKEDDSPEFFELSNLNTNKIKITEPVDVSYYINIFGDKEIAQINKTVDFYIRVNDKYELRITGIIRIGRCELKPSIRDLFNKITSVVLTGYTFIGSGFKIYDDHVGMKIDYTSNQNITEWCDLLAELMSGALENCYAPLRKIAKE